MERKRRAIIILSGGIDSTTALYDAQRKYEEVYALSFDYGQRHRKELDFAKRNCSMLGIPHQIANISNLRVLLQGSALTTEEIEVPEGNYAADNMKLTVVPNRNAIMLSIAFGYAISIDADAVIIGAHSGDHPIYLDCREKFMISFENMEKEATEKIIRLERPFINMNKSEIVKIGTQLNVPYALTWSCYKGKDLHCGRCGTCVERKEAFQLAGVEDPTQYLEE